MAALLVAPLAACGGGDDPPDAKAVDGTFVGAVSGVKALVAVVAAPAQPGKSGRAVQVYVSDGRRLSEWFAGSVAGDGFAATSDDGDAKVDGKLSGGSVTGTVKLPGGRSGRYEAGRATGAAGLYDLTVASDGKLSGASAAGVGVKGRSALRARGTGTLELADGKRRRFDVTRGAAGAAAGSRAGRIRLILLPDGQLGGAGTPRKRAGRDDAAVFIRSAGTRSSN